MGVKLRSSTCTGSCQTARRSPATSHTKQRDGFERKCAQLLVKGLIMHKNSVDQTVHEEDFLFRFCAGLPHLQGEGKALAYYLATGRDSALRLRGLILDHVGREDVSLLEFAAGYGCVTRHLRDALPQADITACDIHNAAVRFIEDQFGIDAIGSISDPDKFSLDRKFDVVFALSFFSHMPKETWARG
jgi:hypothetical protein